MTTLHDDRPHPVPPLAFLRWKENYFFIIIAPDSGVFGMAHFNFEPGFARARLSCNLSVNGQVFNYSNTIPFPDNFELCEEIGDDKLRLRFVEPHQQFDVSLQSDDLELNLSFRKRFSTFDYMACRFAAPEMPSFQEVMTLGLNLPYQHQQQALSITGAVVVKASNTTVNIAGYGYRDHSWCMRADNIVQDHDWCAINFPSCAFGIKTLATNHRPDLRAKEGYVSDKSGGRALRSIEVLKAEPGTDGQPLKLTHLLEDVFGNRFTIESDIASRLADVSLVSEQPSGNGGYAITENFCRSKILETGEEGYSLIELGRSY
jgi:hypothetical protein